MLYKTKASPFIQQYFFLLSLPKMHETNNYLKLGVGGSCDWNTTNKKRSITNIFMSTNTLGHEHPLPELNGGNQKDGDKDEARRESRPIQVDGSGSGGASKRHSLHGAGARGVDGSPHQKRRLWVKNRLGIWWEQWNNPNYLEAKFRSDFRMGRANFDMICKALNSTIAKEDTALRAAIPVQQRVAVCLRRLATGEPLRSISDDFGIGLSTCHKVVLEVCNAICSVLMPRFLQWPDKATAFKAKFEATSGVPNIIGAIYTTHIPIIAPQVFPSAYYNRHLTKRNQKTSYSITLQGVVGPDGTFTDVCIGWPGSMLNNQILEKSSLNQRANNGVMDGSWVVGGASYPLTDWLLVPYTHQNSTWAQQTFNEKVAELQRVATNAFVRLKGRWACLQKRTEVNPRDLPVVLGACCVLHNICEVGGEEMNPELLCDLIDDETVPENPVRSESASKARDKIAHDLLHHVLAGTTI